MDFIYERVRTPGHIKIETVTGGEHYKGKVWREIARQIYCENGRDGYREIGHFASGAPFLYGEDERISISHTEGCLVVATIKTPADANLTEFSPETALGVDVERADREQVIKLRERFLSEDELKLIDAEDIEKNILAWTCKEAMLKAGMDAAIDWHHSIRFERLPSLLCDLEGNQQSAESEGFGRIILPGGEYKMTLRSYRHGPFIITTARNS